MNSCLKFQVSVFGCVNGESALGEFLKKPAAGNLENNTADRVRSMDNSQQAIECVLHFSQVYPNTYSLGRTGEQAGFYINISRDQPGFSEKPVFFGFSPDLERQYEDLGTGGEKSDFLPKYSIKVARTGKKPGFYDQNT